MIGVDEAGYAPRLGPLVVTAVSVECPARTLDLYEALGPVVTKAAAPQERAGRPREADRPLAVADSKVVYRSGKGLGELERGVLAFLAAAGPRRREAEVRFPTDLALASSLDGASLDLRGLDWYAGPEEPLPLAADADDCARAALRLQEAFEGAGLGGLAFRSRVVTARELNGAFACGLNKAEALCELVASLLDGVHGGGCESDVMVDRLGGRKFYGRLLVAAFPGAAVEERACGAEESSYEVEAPSRGLTSRVSFACRAEARSLLVALASMASKYMRELFMRRLNRYFLARCPGLRPTAGYPQDAARFLADTAEFRWESGLADTLLIRER
jgi:hypothetical protein